MSAKLTMLHQKTENKNTANYEEDLASALLDSNVYTYVEQWATFMNHIPGNILCYIRVFA
jgi:hypothetical protein